MTSRYPYPPYRGDRLHAFHTLKALSQEHDVAVLALTNGSEQTADLRAFTGIRTVRLPRMRSWIQAWAGLLSTVPSQVWYCHSSRMKELVNEELQARSFDVVVSHSIRMAPYLWGIDHPLKILLLGDSLGRNLDGGAPYSSWWKRPGLVWERWRVDRFTARAARRFRESWAFSQEDATDLIRLGCPRIAVVPHGVDERLFDLVRTPSLDPTVLFVGNLSVPHNVDAARWLAGGIWPRVRAQWPNARLVLAGADPISVIRKLDGVKGVQVPGTRFDLRETWASAHVLVAPLRFSTGIQNKLLEAMAAGVPVVTSSNAASAVGGIHRQHLLVAETEESIAEAVLETLSDPPGATRRALAARQHVRNAFRWEGFAERLEELRSHDRP